MEVSNTKVMCVLLDALGIKRHEWNPQEEKLEINLNAQQLLYRINASSEAVQHIFGKSDEWRELCGLFAEGMI